MRLSCVRYMPLAKISRKVREKRLPREILCSFVCHLLHLRTCNSNVCNGHAAGSRQTYNQIMHTRHRPGMSARVALGVKMTTRMQSKSRHTCTSCLRSAPHQLSAHCHPQDQRDCPLHVCSLFCRSSCQTKQGFTDVL